MPEEQTIIVVGGVNIDISGTSDTAMLAGDSNPGRVKVTLGGVGRNIAENLARMGAKVRMLTVLGDDANAERVRSSCAELGIDLSLSLTLPGHRTSTYLCVNDADGDVFAAVSDMEIYSRLTPEDVALRLDELNKAALVIVDANMPEEIVRYLAEHLTVPLAADPVSVKKAGKLTPYLNRLLTLKPNRPEASLLTGVPIDGMDGLADAAQVLLERGVQKVFISLGSKGVYYTDGTRTGIQSCCPANIVNTTGCGDAYLAGAALGHVLGLDIAGMALMGQAASAICAEADAAVSSDITLEKVQAKMKQTEG